MAVSIGVDTGGTYTDAVLFDRRRGVLAGAKALTTRHNLAHGIAEAISRVRDGYSGPIAFLSVSTTLATNALAEKAGAPVCIVLLGYPPHALEDHIAEQAIGDDAVVHLRGGHTVDGDEREPLDIEGVKNVAREYGGRVKAFAVSGYFSVRNPQHERRCGELLSKLTDLPVSYGHELSSRLHAGRRALTTAWNARLIPLLSDLVAAVRRVMVEQELHCPLMMVRGDGSLISAETAQQHAVQTILSGPAASVVGAQYLHGIDTACVVDIGGTTTDIAIVRNGRPVVSHDGARVGGLNTMVPAVQMYTVALGGDSVVRLTGTPPAVGGFSFGPERVIPASLAATCFPNALTELRYDADLPVAGSAAGALSRDPTYSATAESPQEIRGGVFLSVAEQPQDRAAGGGVRLDLSPSQQRLVNDINGRLVSRARLLAGERSRFLLQRDLRRLLQRGILQRSGFTPSDAAHVLNRQANWNRDAAELAALALMPQPIPAAVTHPGEPGVGVTDAPAAECVADAADLYGDRDRAERATHVAAGVLDGFVAASARAIVAAVIGEQSADNIDLTGPVARLLVDPAVRRATGPQQNELLSPVIRLNCPIVAVGAPAACYYHDVAAVLGTTAIIPAHSEVANAVGAVVGEVLEQVTVRVTPLDGGERFRLHAPQGPQDFNSLEPAQAAAHRSAREAARLLANDAGAAECEVRSDEQRSTAMVNEGEMLIELVVCATAIGRPHLGRAADADFTDRTNDADGTRLAGSSLRTGRRGSLMQAR